MMYEHHFSFNKVNLFRWLNRVAGGTVKTRCVLALQHCGSDAAVAGS